MEKNYLKEQNYLLNLWLLYMGMFGISAFVSLEIVVIWMILIALWII